MSPLPTREEAKSILEKDAAMTPLQKAEERMRHVFNVTDPYILKVALVTALTVPVRAAPLWVFPVGPPASLKSEILRWFDGPEIYRLSSLTPASLISGFSKNPDVDLLSKLDGRTLVLKDFTSILSMDHRARNEIFAQLREAYDGEYAKDFGNVGHKEYEAHFHLLAGSTSALEEYYTPQSFLGQRFLIARTPDAYSFDTAIGAVRKAERVRDEFRGRVREILDGVDREALKHVDLGPVKEMEPVVELVARTRAHVPRDGGGTIKAYPEIEDPARLAQQTAKMVLGHAVLHGREAIAEDDLAFATRVLRDSVPEIRLKTMRLFHAGGRWPLGDLSDEMGLPQTTVHRVLWDLKMVGILDQRQGEPDGPGRPPVYWEPTAVGRDALVHLGEPAILFQKPDPPYSHSPPIPPQDSGINPGRPLKERLSALASALTREYESPDDVANRAELDSDDAGRLLDHLVRDGKAEARPTDGFVRGL